VSRLVDEAFVSYPEQNFSIIKNKILDIKKSQTSYNMGNPSYKLDYILIRKGRDTVSQKINYKIVFENNEYQIAKLI
jgi:hypothetical protein